MSFISSSYSSVHMKIFTNSGMNLYLSRSIYFWSLFSDYPIVLNKSIAEYLSTGSQSCLMHSNNWSWKPSRFMSLSVHFWKSNTSSLRSWKTLDLFMRKDCQIFSIIPICMHISCSFFLPILRMSMIVLQICVKRVMSCWSILEMRSFC